MRIYLQKILTIIAWLFGIAGILLMTLKHTPFSQNPTLISFINPIIMNIFPNAKNPANLYWVTGWMIFINAIFIQLITKKYFSQRQLKAFVPSKFVVVISYLLAILCLILANLTFFLVDIKPLQWFNDWVLSHILDNQRNKLSLFYMVHGFLLASIAGFLKSTNDKHDKISLLK